MFLLKCGSCGSYHRISEDSVRAKIFGRKCMNCNSPLPHEAEYMMVELANTIDCPDFSHWDIFRIPDDVKASLTVTLLKE